MDQLNLIFTCYDKLISGLTLTQQSFISLALLFILLWQIYSVLRNGHWIFIALLILFLPGTWPAAKRIGAILYQAGLFLWERGRTVIGT